MLLHLIVMCLFTTLPFTTISLGTLRSSNSSNMGQYISKPNCSSTCGDVTVPYPFRIGNDTGCSLDDTFYVTCDTSVKPPKLYLTSSNIEIYNISDSELRINTGAGYKCYASNGTVTQDYNYWTNLAYEGFTFSEKNMFTVIGCDDLALIEWVGDHYFSGCSATCSGPVDVPDGRCSGEGCCQSPIPKGLKYYNVTLNSFRNHTDIWSINDCGYAFLGDVGTFKFLGASDLSASSGLEKRVEANVQVVIDWVIRRDHNCTQATECKQNSQCYKLGQSVCG
uniref:wall-associated receptor kinase 2-like n=1 Tax=Erigeron canadensis TaxID=72917 RepID=UPI001CB993B7|nr:wall-associated receptor kinase 2-like [Erigeron canadensis]XP_043638036.1 wall-associated receptor kinase 2-like [Erigeron canadensis]